MKEIHEIEAKNMLKMAQEAADRAYAPYSEIKVGACLKGESGAYYNAVNVENASYSVGICAERAALTKAIYEGERKFDALAVYIKDTAPLVCGMCLQMLSEFCEPDMPVIFNAKNGKNTIVAFGELFPKPFTIGEKNGK